MLSRKFKELISAIVHIDGSIVLACIVWATLLLVKFVRAVFLRIPVLNINDGYVAIAIIFVIGALIGLPSIIKNLRVKNIVFVYSIIFVYIFTYIIFPQNADVLTEKAGMFFFTVLPLYFVGLSWDTKKMQDYLYWISVATLLCTIIYRVFLSDGWNTAEAEYESSMDLAYDLIPHICLIGYRAVSKKSFVPIGLTAMGLLFLTLLGTRGAVVCLLAFLVLVVLLFAKTRVKILLITVGIGVGAFTMYGDNFTSVIRLMRTISLKAGFSIRIFDKLLNNEFFVSAGRDTIREQMIRAIGEREVTGYGIFGDQALIDIYSHNIIIEFFVDFGVILGSLLLLALGVLIIKKYKQSKSKSNKMFVILLVCGVVMQLMFSSSYLEESLFFLMLGFCMQPEKPLKRVHHHHDYYTEYKCDEGVEKV